MEEIKAGENSLDIEKRLKMIAQAVEGMGKREWDIISKEINIQFENAQSKVVLSDAEIIVKKIDSNSGNILRIYDKKRTN